MWIYQHSRDGHTKRMTLGPMSKIGAAKAKALWKLAISGSVFLTWIKFGVPARKLF